MVKENEQQHHVRQNTFQTPSYAMITFFGYTRLSRQPRMMTGLTDPLSNKKLKIFYPDVDRQIYSINQGRMTRADSNLFVFPPLATIPRYDEEPAFNDGSKRQEQLSTTG